MDDNFNSPEPVVIPESIIVQPDGELQRGLYFYSIVAMVDNKEIATSHILQVYAPNKRNSIIFQWVPVRGASDYRVYRGSSVGAYDGYFNAYSEYFCDNGLGELNLNICQ